MMTPETRGFVVWIAATVVILIAFFIFVATGFPGEKDTCVDDRPHNTCYCEEYDEREINKPGIRQPSNTWFNLYAIGTSFLVALFIYFDRKNFAGNAPNVIGSNSPIADAYIFAVLFLGLGSMWFHASLTTWGGVFDGISMYVYAAYLVFYSIRRFIDSDLLFWVGYGVVVILFTILHAAGIPSVINIMVLVAAYAAIEIYIWVRTGKWMQGKTLTRVLWIGSLVSILLATVFWVLSQTGGPLCSPKSAFQPHGMLWHPLAGLMAVLLYFYWREADDRAELGTSS